MHACHTRDGSRPRISRPHLFHRPGRDRRAWAAGYVLRCTQGRTHAEISVSNSLGLAKSVRKRDTTPSWHPFCCDVDNRGALMSPIPVIDIAPLLAGSSKND